MKRFTNLLKKEIKELVTKQLIFTLLFMVILYNFIGQVSKKEIQKIVGVQTISALDEDGSSGSQDLIKKLASFNYK
ncbi:MAG TPA: ABC transporter permease, partial [Acidobacteriota bacterium]|nr:ABC transporter permease [Acidobacteriota bacterium]